MTKSKISNVRFEEKLFLLSILFLIFLFYFRTVFFEVKAFDEIVPLKGSYLPICNSFSEMFELISLLGLRQHFEASNTFYSHIVSIRCNPFGNFLQLFIQVLFKNNPVNYHVYSLCLHLVNSFFVFFIIKQLFLRLNNNYFSRYFLSVTSVLTFFWATYPVNVESVLLLSNANVILSYTLCFISFYYFIIYIDVGEWFTLKKIFLVYLPFILALFMAEFHFLFPVILFFISLILLKSVSASVKNTMIFFLFDILFICLFLCSNTGLNFKVHSSFVSVVERAFWLSPQIFFHLFKLTFFPLKLSIDQSSLVILGKTLLDPYSIFCILFIFTLTLFCIIDLFKFKSRSPVLFLTLGLFLISLIPFSHLLAPFYNLSSERYLYFPTFLLIFGSVYVLYSLSSKINKSTLICFLLLITAIYSSRAFVRTFDWENSFSLYVSAINTSDDDLYKGFRYKGLVSQDNVFSTFPHELVDQKYQALAIDHLVNAQRKLQKELNSTKISQPLILKDYGLDFETLFMKAGYLYVHSIFTRDRDSKHALKLFEPYLVNLKLQDSAAISFYTALLYYEKQYSKAQEVLKLSIDAYPYIKRLIFPYVEIYLFKNGYDSDLFSLIHKTFIYFPYDSLALLEVMNYYLSKKDYERYAFFSYVYGLRNHSKEHLTNAKNVYLFLKKYDLANRVTRFI